MSDTDSTPTPSYGGGGWGRAVPARDFTTPSGGLCQVKDITIEQMIELGVLDKLDSFGKRVLPQDKPGKKKKAQSVEEAILEKPQDMFGMFEAIDKVILAAVVQPKLEPKPPKNEDGTEPELDEELRYVHLVPMQDRVAIFKEVTPDMSAFFRDSGSQADGVADVADGELSEPGSE